MQFPALGPPDVLKFDELKALPPEMMKCFVYCWDCANRDENTRRGCGWPSGGRCKEHYTVKPGDAMFGICGGPCRVLYVGFSVRLKFGDGVKPDSVTFEQATAEPVAAATALQGLRDKGKESAGAKGVDLSTRGVVLSRFWAAEDGCL